MSQLPSPPIQPPHLTSSSVFTTIASNYTDTTTPDATVTHTNSTVLAENTDTRNHYTKQLVNK